ncbi:MAG: alpha-ketoglutarate-dependent dioxygenase AlkB [Planctomycetota bacterium]
MVALLEITGEPGIAPVPYWKRMVQSLLDHLDHSPGLVAMLSLAILLWILALWFVRHSLGRESGTRLPRQWAVILAVIVALLFGLLLLPIDADAKGQIVQVLGIALPAAVGLASASILGNAIGGLVLQRTANFRLGDFIQVGEHFGRVSEHPVAHRDPDRRPRFDHLAEPDVGHRSRPKVVRRSGTVVSATVSLGYEIPWSKIEAALKEAAGRAGLDEPFVQVLELGDYSVVYRAAGMCQNVRSLLTVRSNLRVHMLDCLHEAGHRDPFAPVHQHAQLGAERAAGGARGQIRWGRVHGRSADRPHLRQGGQGPGAQRAPQRTGRVGGRADRREAGTRPRSRPGASDSWLTSVSSNATSRRGSRSEPVPPDPVGQRVLDRRTAAWSSGPDGWRRPECARLQADLEREVPVEGGAIRLFGGAGAYPAPASVAWGPGHRVCVQRAETRAQALDPGAQRIAHAARVHVQARFNSVLVNLYRDGADSVGWHADDEPELGPEPVIASLSFGAPRRFRWKPKAHASGEGWTGGIELEHGDLLVMSGRSQAMLLHALPRTRATVAARWNLTFRLVRSAGAAQGSAG